VGVFVRIFRADSIFKIQPVYINPMPFFNPQTAYAGLNKREITVGV